MKSRQLWITLGTAVVSFVLGLTLAPGLRKPEATPASELSVAKSGARNPSGSQADNTDAAATRTRLGSRVEKKKNSEPRISIPLSAVEKTLNSLGFDSNIMAPYNGIDRTLAILGATETESTEIRNSLKRAKDDLHAAEKKLIKVIQTDETEIRMDNSALRDIATSVSQQLQTDIRSNLPTDTAEALISNIKWDQFYPTDEKSFPTLFISRSISGRLNNWVMIRGGGSGDLIQNFANDGNPIPADQVYNDRWKPLLKGLTLLPRNER